MLPGHGTTAAAPLQNGCIASSTGTIQRRATIDLVNPTVATINYRGRYGFQTVYPSGHATTFEDFSLTGKKLPALMKNGAAGAYIRVIKIDKSIVGLKVIAQE